MNGNYSNYGVTIDKGVGVFNGDMGIIQSVNLFSEQMTVEFDEGRKIVYPFAQLDELELAYAITIHKSQGSEYPAVIYRCFRSANVCLTEIFCIPL